MFNSFRTLLLVGAFLCIYLGIFHGDTVVRSATAASYYTSKQCHLGLWKAKMQMDRAGTIRFKDRRGRTWMYVTKTKLWIDPKCWKKGFQQR